MRFLPATLVAGLSCVLAASTLGAVSVEQGAQKVTVKVNGELFTEYCFTGAPHVYYYPLIGPGGARMTREWPLGEGKGEEHDHPHHRSLWFSHGNVNGIDFWAEPASFGSKPSPMPLGQIVHDKFLKVQGGEKEGVIQSINKWVGPEGVVPLTSVQTFRVYNSDGPERMFDFEVVLKAGSQPVVMGDTKEGAMALRMAESMRLKQPKGKPAGEGHILNSEGDKDDSVWGKRANWVDYWGPVDGKTVGVAVFDHPGNPKHPTRWHARDYGLFAANPFCEHEMDKSSPPNSGDLTIPAGGTITLRYRFLLHAGDADAAHVAQRYAEYAQSPK